MQTMKKSILALSAVALLASACGEQNARNASQGGITGGAGGFSKSDIGTGLGAVGGAVAGAQFGKGKGQLAGVAIGTLLGAGLGHEIGASLDRADMTYYNQAQYSAMQNGQNGQTLPWNNPQSGNSGTFTPTNYYQNSAGRYCREYNQTINVGGQVQRGYGTACQQPDGSWQIVSQ